MLNSIRDQIQGYRCILDQRESLSTYIHSKTREEKKNESIRRGLYQGCVEQQQ